MHEWKPSDDFVKGDLHIHIGLRISLHYKDWKFFVTTDFNNSIIGIQLLFLSLVIEKYRESKFNGNIDDE